MVRCTGIRMSLGGHHHEHITEIRWSSSTQAGIVSTRQQMVEYVEGGGQAYVQDAFGNRAFLRVRQTANGTKYVQTYADGIWTDNLLALPRF